MATKKPTGWVGWVFFAAVMMIAAGIFQAISGLIALTRDTYFVVGEKGLAVFNYTTWGWLHLIIGILVVAAGMSILRGTMWGRVIGIMLAVVSMVAHLLFIAAYPVWSILIVLVDGLIIYALSVHGEEVKSLS